MVHVKGAVECVGIRCCENVGDVKAIGVVDEVVGDHWRAFFGVDWTDDEADGNVFLDLCEKLNGIIVLLLF